MTMVGFTLFMVMATALMSLEGLAIVKINREVEDLKERVEKSEKGR